MKQKLNGGSGQTPSGTRSFSTTARRNDQQQQEVVPSQTPEVVAFEGTKAVGLEYPDAGFGHKFPLPALGRFTKQDNFRTRYDPIVEQFTKLLMEDGKLSRAQKVEESLARPTVAEFCGY